MSENLNENFSDDPIMEAIFKQAVTQNFERELAEMEKKAEPAQFSSRHERRMAALFARERRKERRGKAFVFAKRASSAAAAVFIGVSLIFLAAPEVRASIRGAAINWFEKFTKFSAGNHGETAANWELSYIPEGFTEASKKLNENDMFIIYENGTGETLVFISIPADDSLSVNNEGVKYGQVLKDGVVYHTFEAESDAHTSSIVWDADGYRFCVDGKLPMSELFRVARSVEKK
jgi:hypothetical protein